MNGILIKKLARLSLCPCGYPALKNTIELGHNYKVPRYNAVGLSDQWICGNCGKEMEVHVIMVLNPDDSVGWLPMELFDWDETPKMAETDLKETRPGTSSTESSRCA